MEQLLNCGVEANMALVYFSTNQKKTRKQREKEKLIRQQLKQQEEDKWEAYKTKYGLKEKKNSPLVQPWRDLRSVSCGPLRPGAEDFKKHDSKDSGLAVASKKQANVYTGTNIIGIGTLHKSNAVPIFSEEHAVDLATMRRN